VLNNAALFFPRVAHVLHTRVFFVRHNQGDVDSALPPNSKKPMMQRVSILKILKAYALRHESIDW